MKLVTADVSSLRIGSTLSTPIYDARKDRNDVLLLSAGTTLTHSLMDRLIRRGISQVLISPQELARVREYSKESFTEQKEKTANYEFRKQSQEAVERAEKQSRSQLSTGPKVNADSYVHKMSRPETLELNDYAVDLFADRQELAGRRIDSIYDSFSKGDMKSAERAAEISQDALLRLAEDLDLFVLMGTKPNPGAYPIRHSLQTAELSMAIGSLYGLTEQELIDLGIGCLIHDVGMLHLPKPYYLLPRELTAAEFLEVKKHPRISCDLISDVKQISVNSLAVAFQMHERFNGTGYPRGRRGKQIHHLARIAMVADSYIAMISPRAHRPAFLAYHAVEQIVFGVKSGLYDPEVVRCFLNTVSLFPIGSYVRLSDQRIGRVIRSNRDQYNRPVVEIWEYDQVFQKGERLICVKLMI